MYSHKGLIEVLGMKYSQREVTEIRKEKEKKLHVRDHDTGGGLGKLFSCSQVSWYGVRSEA